MNDDQPPILEKLLDALTGLISQATVALQQSPSTVEEWQAAIEILLARYSIAAMMAGTGGPSLDDKAMTEVKRLVKVQLEYLDNFALEIQQANEWQAGWNARAEMYARSIKVPYWRGATQMLPLPAMPAQGTQCLSNCKCSWEIVPVDEQAGNYDCYWRRASSDSCQTCVQRAAEWSPLQIRDGSLVI